MHERDEKSFAHRLGALFALYNEEITDQTMTIWWECLKGYDIDDVCRAMSMHAKDPERGFYKPMPADMVKHITITMPKLRAEAKARLARSRAEMLAPLDDKIRKAANDVKLGLKTPAEYHDLLADVEGQMRQVLARPEFKKLQLIPHG